MIKKMHILKKKHKLIFKHTVKYFNDCAKTFLLFKNHEVLII